MAKMDSKTLGSIFAHARKQAVNFALLTGQKEMVFEAHRTKSIEAMHRLAKADGGGPKGAWGTMRLSGKKLEMTCEVAPYGTFAKDAKKFFAGLDQNVQVIVCLKDTPERISETPERESDTTVKDAATDESAADEAGIDDENVETDYAQIIKSARKAPLNFAWLLSKDSLVLRAHRRKPVPALIKSAKADGATQRGAWGQFRVNGKVIVLTCVEDPPSVFVRAARIQLRSAGFKFQVEVHGPAGVTVSQDEEDGAQDVGDLSDAPATDISADTTQGEVPGAPQAVNRLLGEYREVFAAIKPLLDGTDPAVVKALKAELLVFSRTLVARDTETATVLLEDLRRHLTGSQTVRATILPDLLTLEGKVDALLASLEHMATDTP